MYRGEKIYVTGLAGFPLLSPVCLIFPYLDIIDISKLTQECSKIPRPTKRKKGLKFNYYRDKKARDKFWNWQLCCCYGYVINFVNKIQNFGLGQDVFSSLDSF